MKKGWTAVGGAGVGAVLMYLFDPERGKRRRALLNDKLVHALHTGRDRVDVASRNVANRAYGFIARGRSLFRRERVPDGVLAERVRSRIGHVVSYPGSVEVSVGDDCVRLAGPVLAKEVQGLLEAVSHVRGVTRVENRLEIHEEADGVPGLQGGRTEGPRAHSISTEGRG